MFGKIVLGVVALAGVVVGLTGALVTATPAVLAGTIGSAW